MSHSIFPPDLSVEPLPDFGSLVIQGPYPPSAPLHLCLSHLKSGPPSNKPVLLSPSSKHLTSTLEEYNDAWLGEHATTGAVAEYLHQIDIFYPPTAGHLRLLLARLRTHSTPGADADPEADMRVCLTRPPTLLILHEPSTYFLTPNEGEDDVELPTLSTYMQLVVESIAALTFIHKSRPSSTRPRLAIFDTQLHDLVLPIYRPIRNSLLPRLGAQQKALMTDAIKRLVGWVGTVERGKLYQQHRKDMTDTRRTVEEIPSSQADEMDLSGHEFTPEREHFRMGLVKGAVGETWEWYTSREPERPFSTRRRMRMGV